MHVPFTYALTHIPTGKRYYGVRYSKKCDPSDLWVTYFSSSKRVRKLLEQDGPDAFTYEVRRTFVSVDHALKWEQRVLKRLKVVENDNWLNAHYHDAKFKCLTHNQQTRAKISRAGKGRIFTDEHKRKKSKAQRRIWDERRANGYKRPESANQRGAEKARGRKHARDGVERMRQSKMGRKRVYLPDGSFVMRHPDQQE